MPVKQILSQEPSQMLKIRYFCDRIPQQTSKSCHKKSLKRRKHVATVTEPPTSETNPVTRNPANAVVTVTEHSISPLPQQPNPITKPSIFEHVVNFHNKNT